MNSERSFIPVSISGSLWGVNMKFQVQDYFQFAPKKYTHNLPSRMGIIKKMGMKISQKRRLETGSACVFLFMVAFFLSCARQPLYPAPPIRGSEVVIDVNRLEPESPIFFTFRYHVRNVNFFVYKTQGQVLSFLDACASCYPSKRGYRVAGRSIICRTCDVSYTLSNIEKGFGGCFPIRIEGDLRNGEYHIPVSLLEGAVDRFS